MTGADSLAAATISRTLGSLKATFGSGANAPAERLRPHHRLLTRVGQEPVSMVTGTSSGTVHSLPLDLAVMLRRTGSFA